MRLLIAMLGLLLASCASHSKHPSQSMKGNHRGALSVFQWHPVELIFDGPFTAEQASPNPFTDAVLYVEFSNGKETQRVRGFYAADGNSGKTGSGSGNKWAVRFTPSEPGTWTWNAQLKTGPDIALRSLPKKGGNFPLKSASGEFLVLKSDKVKPDFRALGSIEVENGYFYAGDQKTLWKQTAISLSFLKGIPELPEMKACQKLEPEWAGCLQYNDKLFLIYTTDHRRIDAQKFQAESIRYLRIRDPTSRIEFSNIEDTQIQSSTKDLVVFLEGDELIK